MPNELHLLLIEDSESDAVAIEAALRKEGFAVRSTRVWTLGDVRRSLMEGPWDLVITEYALQSLDGLEVLQTVAETGSDIPTLLVSGKIGEEAAVQAMRAGARDYISKDRLARLGPVVRRELKELETRRSKRSAEQKFEVAFRSSPDSIALTALEDGRFLEVNQAFERITGYSRGEVLGKTTLELGIWSHPDERARFLATLRDEGSVKEAHLPVRTKDGHNRNTLMAAEVVDVPEGRAILSVVRDVTDERRTRRELERSEERFSKAFYANPNPAVIATRSDGTILEVNEVLCRMAGVPREELVGRNGIELELWSAASAARMQRILERHGEVRDLEISARGRNGVSYELLLSAVTVEMAGEPCILNVGVDITERKRLQAQLLRAQRLESIGMLSGGIAHDLNNVLTPILMAIKLLRRDRPHQRERVLSILETNAHRGADLIRQLLTFARGAEGQQGPVAVFRVVEEVAKVVRDTFPKSIELEVALDEGLWPAAADPTQLHRVMLNLAVNARDAMDGCGSLSIIARNRTLENTDEQVLRGLAPGRYVEVEVADTGPGIPPQFRRQVFDPFFTTKETGRGTGLGLSTAESIVTDLGGVIEIEDGVDDRGVRFLVSFPAAEGSREGGERRSALTPASEGNGELILVVDDEAAVREIAAGVLEASGYRTVPAANGRAALDRFAEHRGELRAVVIDLMMPEMDGAETIRELRRLAPDLPTIAVSGAEGDCPEGEPPVGADLFLCKPLTAEELLEGLRLILRDPGDEAEQAARSREAP